MLMPVRNAATPAAMPIDVMLVSAETDDGRRLGEALAGADWPGSVDRQTSLAGALARLAETSPAVILLDLHLPGSSPAQSWRQLREQAGDTPIVVLAGAADDPDVLAALRGGAEDCLLRSELSAPLLRRVIRYAAERQRVRRQLADASRMEAVGRLAGGVAHDFKNLLQVIIANLYLLEPLVRHDAAALHRLQTARRAAARNGEVIKRLLSFSSERGLEPRTIDPNELILGLRDLLERTLGRDLQVELELQQGVWPICCDPSQLENAVVNLAINARDAMPNGGSLTISTRNQSLDAAFAGPLEIGAGDYVAIALQDTGEGIPPELSSRIFEPFFTTKAPGKGSGLGLSMVRGFVKQSRGTVTLVSPSGGGTTATLYLPRTSGGRIVSLDETVQVAPLRMQSTRVIVADPEPQVHEALSATLGSLGFAATGADSLAEVERLLDAHPDTRVVLIDDALDTTGGSLAEMLSRRSPAVQVLWMSAADSADDVAQAADGAPLLRKPIQRSVLVNSICAALNASGE